MIEQPDRDFVSPLDGLFKCRSLVAWIVIFKFLDALFEKGSCVVPIESDTGAKHINKGEAPVLHAVVHQFRQLSWVTAKSSGNVSRSSDNRHSNRIERSLYIAKRGAFSFHIHQARRRGLTDGQPVNLVVHHNIEEVDIFSHRMNEVISADAVSIPITAGNNHVHFVIRKFRTGSHSKRTSM